MKPIHPVRDYLGFLVLQFLLLVIYANKAQCITIEEMTHNLSAEAFAQANVRFKIDIHYEPTNSQIKEIIITSLGSTLLQKTIYASGGPHIQKVERFSTNGYSNYEIGGVSGGQKFSNEASLDAARPVTGIALFASRFYQSQILTSLDTPGITDSRQGEEPVYIVNGVLPILKIRTREGTIKTISTGIKLVFAAQDFLLLDEEVGPLSSQLLKFKASRQNHSGDWPYGGVISSELWADNELKSKVNCLIAADQSIVGPGEQIPKLVIPAHTLVADGVAQKTFFTGPKYTKSEINEMEHIKNHNPLLIRSVIICLIALPLPALLFFAIRKKFSNKMK